MRHNEIQRRFRWLREGNAVKNRHQDNAPATTAIGRRHRHTSELNNGGKMKISKKHQTFEIIV